MEEDPVEAAKGTHVFYTDVWVSMGEAKEVWQDRISKLLKYKVTEELISYGEKDSIFMHCLPAFHNTETTVAKEIMKEFGIDEMEVSNSVFEGEKSVVFDQAENRLHTIKAVMVGTLKGE